LTSCANALMKSAVGCENFHQLIKDKPDVIAFRNNSEDLKLNAYLYARGQTTKNLFRNGS